MDALVEKKSEPPRRYLGASGIGRECSRAIWYDFRNAPGSACPASLKITFDIGKRLEGLVINYLEESGLQVEYPSEANQFLECFDEELPIFRGHADALLCHQLGKSVVEIKTANSSSFQRFVKHGLREWSKVYYAQIQSYLGMMKLHNAVIIALNKDNSDLHHEWVNYDDIFYHELRVKAMAISSIDEPPERINNSPLYYICRGCKFKEVCFESNRN